MDDGQIDLIIKGSSADYADLARDSLGLAVVGKWESPIEESLALAIDAKGIFLGHYGASCGGGYMHLFVDYEFPEVTDLITDTCWQVDLVRMQYDVLGYRTDFAIRRYELKYGGLDRIVLASQIILVECDGHDFHERTKEQASRDKSRDRELHSAGFLVLRFSGSEIWKDPYKCATQIMDCLDSNMGARSLAMKRSK